jgi:DNA repair exonuclease SbcCD nuclease subunit
MLNIDDVLVFHSPFVYDNIFLGHMLLREAQIGPTDFRKLDEMSLDELVAKYPGCRAYLLGDVHKYQVLHNAPLVMYSGSVVPVDFGERNDVKGVTILQVDFRPNHPPGIWGGAYALSTGGDLHWKFISLKTRPMIQYVYECNKRAFVEFSCPATENYVSEAIVKVILRGTKEQLTQTDEKAMRDLFTAAKELYLEYDIIKDTRSRDERVNETVSAAQALELYLEKQDMPHEQRTRVLDLGKQIIDGVKTDA